MPLSSPAAFTYSAAPFTTAARKRAWRTTNQGQQLLLGRPYSTSFTVSPVAAVSYHTSATKV